MIPLRVALASALAVCLTLSLGLSGCKSKDSERRTGSDRDDDEPEAARSGSSTSEEVASWLGLVDKRALTRTYSRTFEENGKRTTSVRVDVVRWQGDRITEQAFFGSDRGQLSPHGAVVSGLEPSGATIEAFLYYGGPDLTVEGVQRPFPWPIVKGASTDKDVGYRNGDTATGGTRVKRAGFSERILGLSYQPCAIVQYTDRHRERKSGDLHVSDSTRTLCRGIGLVREARVGEGWRITLELTAVHRGVPKDLDRPLPHCRNARCE